MRDLGYDNVREIYDHSHPGGDDFDDALRTALGVEPPETVNTEHRLVIVASALDAASERIVDYAQGFGLPVNVVFFQTFKEHGAEYLTRTRLAILWRRLPCEREGKRSCKLHGTARTGTSASARTERETGKTPLNTGSCPQAAAAGTSSTLLNLPIGGRVFVNIPGSGPGCGYVGVGIVTGVAMPVREFQVNSPTAGRVPLTQMTRAAELETIAEKDDELTEWIVPVAWINTAPRTDAITFKGRYGNQNSATKLRDPLTRETVLERLKISENTLDAAAEAAPLPPSSLA